MEIQKTMMDGEKKKLKEKNTNGDIVPDLRLHLTSMVTNTGCYWHKNRHIG